MSRFLKNPTSREHRRQLLQSAPKDYSTAETQLLTSRATVPASFQTSAAEFSPAGLGSSSSTVEVLLSVIIGESLCTVGGVVVMAGRAFEVSGSGWGELFSD